LYFRLNGVALALPPLRERVDEIEPLARAFVSDACRRMGRRAGVRFEPNALALLQQYGWPGNIRELRNVIERAVLLCTGEVITRSHLPVEKMAIEAPLAAATSPLTQTLSGARTRASQPPGPRDAERERIIAVLEKCAGNQSEAAKVLGIGRNTLIRRLDEYGVPRPKKRDA
jgi:DNA-binding NtrC family response regulator